jgi:hypothetical protein
MPFARPACACVAALEARSREILDWLKVQEIRPKPFLILLVSPKVGPEAVKVLMRLQSRTTARALMQQHNARLKPEEGKAPAKP